jgi:hypothetical protein
MSYDGLSSRLVAESELHGFLSACFGVAGPEVFVGCLDTFDEHLRQLAESHKYTVFCTWWQVRGHFAMGFDVVLADRLYAKVGRQDFAEQFAARFDANVLYGDAEPDMMWTVVLADGTRLLATLAEDDDPYVLGTASGPVPGLPEVHVDANLWQRL